MGDSAIVASDQPSLTEPRKRLKMPVNRKMRPLAAVLPYDFLRNFSPARRIYTTSRSSVTDDAPCDAQLVEAARRGDRDAFGQLVLRYQDRLFSATLRRVNSHHVAEDVVQNAFIQAFRKLDSFRGDSKFYTWLYEIAKNMANSELRRTKTIDSLDKIKTDSGGEPIGRNVSPEGAAQAQEKVHAVRAGMAQLSEEHREVLQLCDMDGCAYDEIAEILGLELGTVKSRIYRARQQMEKLLGPEWGDRAQAKKGRSLA
jgi:RNA polymerase sigma-70 factor (ECF subfamily)